MRQPTLSVQHCDVFARGPGGGNPCPIVLDAGALSTETMQALAAHYGQETGFAMWDADGTPRLRYFVPRHEMTMCVHATVAAITTLLLEGALGGEAVTVRTASGDCLVSWDDARPRRVTVEQQPPEFGPSVAVHRELEEAAGLSAGALDPSAPIRAVSVSRAKLIVPVRDARAVHAARPRFEQLAALCRRLETTGAYLFAPHPDARPGHLVARQFPVGAGYPEDAATGVAAAALAAYLAAEAGFREPGWLELTIEQGDTMGRPSTLQASAYADLAGVHRTAVSGQATLRRREALALPLERPFASGDGVA